MSRGKWTYDTEKKCLVEVQAERPRHTHFVITDEIPGGMQSMVNGQWFTSKSEYRRHLKRNGYIEKGNDTECRYEEDTEAIDRQLQEDAEAAWYAVRDGMADLSELDRERCKIIDHNLEHYNYDRRERDDWGNPID